jgi:ubiquinone/menaquinone biosynthesis C-methylase UbiE
MSSSSDFWKRWWDEQARQPSSDFVLNRRTAIRVDALEKRAHDEFLGAIAPQPGDMILDAGCGSGRNLSLLAPLVTEVVGVDYSIEMLARAKDRIAKEHLSNAKVERGDVTLLPFLSDSFDVVVCASVLQYLDDRECTRAIHEMIRVCKPGGRLVFHVKNGTSLYGCSLRLSRIVSKMIGRPTKPEHYRSRRWHERTLAAAGAALTGFYGFGIFTFVPLPGRVVATILQVESWFPVPHALRRFAVNYQLALRVNKTLCATAA